MGHSSAQLLEQTSVCLRNEGSFTRSEVIGDLERVQYVEVEHTGKRFRLRSELQGTAGRVFQAAGVAAPPTVQQVPEA